MNRIEKIHSRGVSLLETIIWIGIFTIVMGAIMSTVLFIYRSSRTTFQGASAVTSAQHGVDVMIRTLREAAYASDGAYPIVSFGANDIVFYANIDSDSLNERVHYYLQDTYLYQGALKPSGDPPVYSGVETVTQLAENVQNLTLGTGLFTYFDEDGASITNYTNLTGLRFVTTNLLVDENTSLPPSAVTIRSSAALRNIVGK